MSFSSPEYQKSSSETPIPDKQSPTTRYPRYDFNNLGKFSQFTIQEVPEGDSDDDCNSKMIATTATMRTRVDSPPITVKSNKLRNKVVKNHPLNLEQTPATEISTEPKPKSSTSRQIKTRAKVKNDVDLEAEAEPR